MTWEDKHKVPVCDMLTIVHKALRHSAEDIHLVRLDAHEYYMYATFPHEVDWLDE